MALFQNKPQASDNIQYFSMGQNKIILLVGLGNPGKEYDLTRHNIGFHAIDSFVDKTADMSSWSHKRDLKCDVSTGRVGETQVIAIKPTTFMNLSGEAVQATANFYKIPLDNIVTIYDDLDIDFGQIRLRIGGSSAGHNGIKSITQHIGEEYGRIRIGIGPKMPARMDTDKFVLQQFPDEQQEQLNNLCKETGAILSEYIYSGNPLPNDTRSFIF